jgi:hypothetical protein
MTLQEYIDSIENDSNTLEIIKNEEVASHSTDTKERILMCLKKDSEDPTKAEIIHEQFYVYKDIVYKRA